MRDWLVLALVVLMAGASEKAAAKAPSAKDVLRMARDEGTVSARLKRYVAVELGVHGKAIDPEVSEMIPPILDAAQRVDRVFWSQRSPEAVGWLKALAADKSKRAGDLSAFLRIHYGPWDVHSNDEPFVGVRLRPPGMALYPADLSRYALEAFVNDHPASAVALRSPYTVVKRKGGGLAAVSYSKAYGKDLRPAAGALEDAARAYACKGEKCSCAGLVAFLKGRAASFLDDDYRKSEALWLDTGACPLDVAIGPYEVYMDRLTGTKTFFEAIVYYRNEKETKRAARLLKEHEWLAFNLPLSEALRGRFMPEKPSHITIADVLYTAGEARAGFQIRGFMLPNDETVRREKGTKKVILRNVVKAKFEKLVKPIAKRIFERKVARRVNFGPYFDHLLSWQLAHALVPQEVELPGGSKTSPRVQLHARYSFVEALRGETVALVNHLYLIDKEVFSGATEKDLCATYLASLFDTIRVAEGSPQTLAKIVVYSYLAAEGVFRYYPRSRTFEVDAKTFRESVRKLAAEALEILARGDYDGAGRLIVQHGIMPPELRAKLGELRDLPVEILPRYTAVTGAK